MSEDPDLREQLERMRRDWDARAAEDAEYYVRTPDESGTGFDESGRISYQEQLQPFLELLLDGKSPRDSRVVEIGCGVGRMTRWVAKHFKEVHGVDISAEMLARARERLRDCPNVTLHLGSGADLAGLPEAYFDLAFSYIVFQHIPSREVVAAYIRDTARVLRPGGGFRFQLSGWRGWEYRRAAKDSWLGESFSVPQVLTMLRDANLEPLGCEGTGTQEMVVMARKPRDLSRANPELLRRVLEERRAWEENLSRELLVMDQEPPEQEAHRLELEQRTAWGKSLEEELAVARRHLEEQQKGWEAELSTARADLAEQQKIGEAELNKARADLAELQRAFAERTAWTQQLSAELEQARQDLSALQREFDERTVWAQSLEAELERTRTHFAELQKAFDERTAWALQMRDELESRKP